MSLKGIDISRWQSGINLFNIDADFVIVKSSEGIGYADPNFKNLYNSAKKAGKKLGVYHFARPTASNNPIVEADSFLNIIKEVNAIGEAVLALDWEAENQHNTAWAKSWLDRVYEKTGIKPLIYMSESVVNSYNWNEVAKAGYQLWVAKYRDMIADYNYDMSLAGISPKIKWWDKYIMWQWTSCGRLNGWSGNLDCDEFYGNTLDWYSLAGRKEEDENNFSQYSDEQLADMAIAGKLGNGENRKKILGSRYEAVQSIINIKMAEQTIDSDEKDIINYKIKYSGYPIYIIKISKNLKIRGSIDGNQYGTYADKTIPAGFGDNTLIKDGYTEISAQNGSTFYSWGNATYAEGLEKSRGVNNQNLGLSAVTKFNNCMAIGFPTSGGIWFGPQYEIANNLTQMYGAITGIFGIIYAGKKNFMGSNIDRNNGFYVKSGRSIIAEDDYYYYSICFKGNTGSTGLTGPELYDLCVTISPQMTNAICFDGGGSVFQRFEGAYNINTTRAVKNAILLFAKEKLDGENELDRYSDEELAKMVLEGKFGNGVARKEALSDRYAKVQLAVNKILNS